MNYRTLTLYELERLAYCGDMKAAVALAAQAEYFVMKCEDEEVIDIVERTEKRVMQELFDVYSGYR